MTTNSPITVDTALILWAEEVERLAVAPEQVEQAIAGIHERMGHLHQWYSAQGDLDTAKYIADTFEQARLIYTQNQQQQVALAAGRAAVETLAEQRASAINDLYGLTDAIRRRSEEHPALADYAAEIRVNTRDLLLEDENFLEQAELESFQVIERQVRATLHRYGLSAWQSQRLLEYLCGMFQMDTEQTDALTNFLNTLS